MADSGTTAAILPTIPARPALVDWLWERAMDGVETLDSLTGFSFLRRNFRRTHGYPLNLDDPRSFNAKIQWRKIRDHNPLFPVLVDKLRMREHVVSVLGPDAVGLFPDLLLVTDDPDDIDLTQLPPDIAIKATHACGWNILLPAGAVMDTETVRRTCRTWLRLTYGHAHHEWAYSRVPPRILVERLFLSDDGRLADDLKFFMFGETCAFVGIAQDRHGTERRCYATADWQPAGFRLRDNKDVPLPPKPPGFEAMLDIARRLGAGLDHLRVDFLLNGTGFRLGELTIYHASGLIPFSSPELDFRIGEYWTLPGKRA